MKNIYEIVAINPTYTGVNNIDLSDVVVYKALFQKDKFFVREYGDLVDELNDEEKELYHQSQRVEPLTEEEISILEDEEFIKQKMEYLESKYEHKKGIK